MPIDFGVKVSGLLDEEGSEKFTAPLPVFGLSMDVALTPKWFIRSGAQVFYLQYDNFTGSILEFRTALEYNPWKHVGIGVGFDTFGLRLEADGEDWPGIDLKGNVEFNYAGVQLYAVKDRTPRVYPWMNEPDGGIMPPWNTQRQLTVYTIFGTTWFGFANTAVGS